MFNLFNSPSTPNVSRLKAKRDINGLLDALHHVENPDLTRQAAKALDELNWQPEADEDGAAYWIAKEAWSDTVRAGVSAVEPLLDVLRVHGTEVDQAGNFQKAANHIAVIQEAIKALVRIGTPAVHLLVDALSDKDIFEPVGEALVKIGAPSLQPLLYALREANEYDLVDLPKVLDNLGWHPDKSETGVLYYIGKGRLDRCVPLGAVAVQPLIMCFRFRGALRIRLGRQAVVDALAQMGLIAVEPLLRALHSENEAIRQGALESLGKIGDPKTAAAVESARVLIARKASAQVSKKESLEEIQKSMQDTNWRTRRTAVEALGRIGSQQGDIKLRSKVLAMLDVAFKDTEELVRVTAVESLAGLRDPRGVRLLAKILEDRSENVRLAVVEALGRTGDPASLRYLVTMLRDPKKRVRTAAVWSMAQINDPAAVKPLLAVMQGSDSYLSQPAAEALDKLGWKPGNDETGAAYWAARRSWEDCVDLGAAAVKPLIHVLECFRSVRGAAWALGQLCLKPDTGTARRPAVEALIRALDHYDDDMRETAARTLVHIYPSSLIDDSLKAQIRTRQKDISGYGISLPG